MGKPQTLEAPYHSLDPADWWMYCDLLQEQGAPTARWLRARKVADSLASGAPLALIFHCPEGPLEDHWLRVGRTWFIPVSGTYVEYISDFCWWRPAWVLQGFLRYQSRRPRRKKEAMIAYASGTPYAHGYADFDALKKKFDQQVVKKFFDTHAYRRQPQLYR